MIIVHGPVSVKASLINREPFAEAGSWFVYQSPRGKFSAIDSGDRITVTELKAENYKYRYTVEKFNSPVKYQNEYQSKNPGRSFQVAVRMEVAAQNPALIVQSEVTDVEETVVQDIEFWLSHLCSQYKIEDFQQLKLSFRDMETTSELKNDLESKGFLISKFEITISLSDEDMAFYRMQEQIKQNEEIERLKLVEMKRTQELKIQAEEEERERQRQRQKVEHFEQLQKEREEEEKRKRLKEEKRVENERLAQRFKLRDSEALILEREENITDNVNMLLSREDEEKEHQRKLELARFEAELKAQEKREEHLLRMEEKRMEMLLKIMDTQMKAGGVEESLLRTVINGPTNSADVLIEKKPADPLLSWGEDSPDALEEVTDGDDASSNKNVWEMP